MVFGGCGTCIRMGMITNKNIVIGLVVLMILLSLGALFGGVFLIVDSTGESMGFNVEMLEDSPFEDYLIPGLFLLVVFGVVPLVNVYYLVKKKSFGYYLSNLIWILLVLWII